MSITDALELEPLTPLTPQRRRDQTRRCLLDAAAKVFAERGFHGASLDDVATAAGFTKGAVYSNFASKDDLFLALLESKAADEMETLRATIAASDVPPEERLSDFVALLRSETTEATRGWEALYQEFCLYAMRNPQAAEKLSALDRASARSIAALIEVRRAGGGSGDEPAEDVARVIVAMFHGVGLMRTIDPGAVDERFLEVATAFVARAVGTPPGRTRR